MENLATILSFVSLFVATLALSVAIFVCYLTFRGNGTIDYPAAHWYPQPKIAARGQKLKPRAKSDEDLYRDEKNGK